MNDEIKKMKKKIRFTHFMIAKIKTRIFNLESEITKLKTSFEIGIPALRVFKTDIKELSDKINS